MEDEAKPKKPVLKPQTSQDYDDISEYVMPPPASSSYFSASTPVPISTSVPAPVRYFPHSQPRVETQGIKQQQVSYPYPYPSHYQQVQQLPQQWQQQVSHQLPQQVYQLPQPQLPQQQVYPLPQQQMSHQLPQQVYQLPQVSQQQVSQQQVYQLPLVSQQQVPQEQVSQQQVSQPQVSQVPQQPVSPPVLQEMSQAQPQPLPQLPRVSQQQVPLPQQQVVCQQQVPQHQMSQQVPQQVSQPFLQELPQQLPQPQQQVAHQLPQQQLGSNIFIESMADVLTQICKASKQISELAAKYEDLGLVVRSMMMQFYEDGKKDKSIKKEKASSEKLTHELSETEKIINQIIQ